MLDRRVLVRRPSSRLASGLVTHIERQPVDVDLALRQWQTYVAALETAGWEIIEVPPMDECPDGVFIEDDVVDVRRPRRGRTTRRRRAEARDGGDRGPPRRPGYRRGLHRGAGDAGRRRRPQASTAPSGSASAAAPTSRASTS